MGLSTEEIMIPYGEKEFNAYLAAPENSKPKAGLIIIEEIWGLNENIRDIARRYAQQGYAVLSPELLAETGVLEKINPNIFAEMQNPAQRDAAQVKMREATQPLSTKEFAVDAIQKLLACFEYLQKLLVKYPDNDKIAVLGFCFGGTYAFHLATHEPRLKACLAFYGQAPQPIEDVAKITCPVIAFYGEKDERLIASLPDLKSAMQKAGKEIDKDFTAVIYPNAGHAFFNDANPRMYQKEAAEDAWKKTLDFLEKNIS
jgi:carboxymethylenebutenolidase